jgi:uncharacterized protein involved in exopolysaccharide biosynthesis
MTIDFKFYLSLFLRRLPYFLLLVSVGSAIGITLATVLPPVFRAEAVLIVESQQIPSDLAETTVQVEASEQLQIIQQRILTRERLLEMANRLEIYSGVNAPAERMTADEIVTDLRRRITIQTTGGAGARGQAQATIVRISFTAATAQLSSNVANEIVTLVLQENVEMRTGVAGQTLEYFTEEVARLDQELAVRGAAILEFQEQNLQALPDSLDFRRSQQAAAQERLVQLSREEATLNDRRIRLVSLYEATGQVGLPENNVTLSVEEQQLLAMREELSAALAILSPQNPRIRLLQAQIDALETRVAAQVPIDPTTPEGTPELSAYEIQLADLDGQLQFIRDQQQELRTQMAALQASIEATPGNAITLDTLQRDYANVRTQYDQAVSNRARAETGDTIEALAKGQRITVIEQAIPPAEPESPNRPLLAAAGVGGGLALGLGFVVLLEFLNGAIRRPVDITSRLGITPLGTLPLIRTRWEIVRRRAIIAAGFAIALIVIPAGLWYVHTEITPLDALMNRILARLR